MKLEQIRSRVRELGAGPRHERQVLRAWTLGLPLDSGPRRAEGFLCGNPTVGFTRDSKMQATPGGRWSVSCRVVGQNTPSPVPF